MSILRISTGLPLVLALVVVQGCNGDDTGTATATATATDTSQTTGGSDSATSAPTTTASETTGGSAGTSSTSASTTSAGTTTASSSSTGETTGGLECLNEELGAACVQNCDCVSKNCFIVGPLGGICSECNEDADCAATTGFGCNFGNPLEGTPAVCSVNGELGEGCENADVCAPGLFCPLIIEVLGILSMSACSECETDTDCPAQECAPILDIANIRGHLRCVDAGTVPNDEGCDLSGDGAECESGQCAPASIMGIPFVGVCSPCNEDTDCGGGQTCQFPEVGIEGSSFALIPGACV